MKLTGLFKRGAACLCTAAILMGGVSAFALTPALPDEPDVYKRQTTVSSPTSA